MAGISRRAFLQLAAVGSGATLGLHLGSSKRARLIPYVAAPPETEPGAVALYATTCADCTGGCGMLLRHVDGRVLKAEGNPDHPVSRGGLCARGQSSVQGLYDPDRLRRVGRRAQEGRQVESDWPAATAAIAERMTQGRVAVLSRLESGTMREILGAFTAAFAGGEGERLLLYEPFDHGPMREAWRAAAGRAVVPEHRFDRAELVVSFGADFLESWPSPVGAAQRFADMHVLDERRGGYGRFVYVGPRLTMTAANADTYLQVPPGGERVVALATLRALLAHAGPTADAARLASELERLAPDPRSVGVDPGTIDRIARRFAEADGALAIGGAVGHTDRSAHETARAAAWMNVVAGGVGRTVRPDRPHALTAAAGHEEVEAFLDGLGPDDVLFVVDANPAYHRPGSIERLRRAGTLVYLGTQPDETAALADWVLPADFFLESWGDAEPFPGVHGLRQPTLRRLHDTRQPGDVLLGLAQAAGADLTPPEAAEPAEDAEDWLRERWQRLARRHAPDAPFEVFFRSALRRGGLFAETDGDARDAGAPAPDGTRFEADETTGAEGLALWTWPHALLGDGRVAGRPWLQEVPEPTTQITWGSWVDLHPDTARALGVEDGEVVALEREGVSVTAPARVSRDVAPGTAALPFGQGHAEGGRWARGRGANAFALLAGIGPAGAPPRVRVRGTGETDHPAYATHTREPHDRDVMRWAPLATVQAARAGDARIHEAEKHPGLYGETKYPKHRWGMAIDLQRCIGCGACAVACYAENNVPWVGAEGVRRGRRMAWLAVVPYRHPHREDRLGFVPMLCQHCGNAPCEPVCPTYAAHHTDEGLNAQVYNRCVGTRYCANACPYKVRRFEWFEPTWPEPMDMQLNPDVSVRSGGVMEKCTFCVQRIRRVERRADREGRPIRDGEIQPACAESCPTNAIVFGDLEDPDSRVARLHRESPRRYRVLEHLDTDPAIAYLRRIETGDA